MEDLNDKKAVKKLIEGTFTGDRWLCHLKEDLLKFWDMPEALGEELGNFPTYRNNDGTLVDFADPSPEFINPVPGIVFPDRDYVRAKSRQSYAYGVAFHMTGEMKYLKYMLKGLEYIKTYALDRQNGGFFSYNLTDKNEWGPAPLQRTSQDLAYALSAFAFFYYLTHDKKTIEFILSTKKYIFDIYFDKGWDMLRWVRESNIDGDTPDQKQIVSQLDQIYAYLIWLTPCLSKEYRIDFEESLQQLAYTLIDQFYTPRYQIFFGKIGKPTEHNLDATNTDFGHSIKTFWMIYTIGQWTKRVDLIDFARQHMTKLLKKAYIEEKGSWARCFRNDGSLDTDKEWWIFCELDQVAATLSLRDPRFCEYIAHTYLFWFTCMVDHVHGEVWHMVNGETNKPVPGFPKQHAWKNAWHTFEHALIGYITGQQLHNLPVTLYYAFQGGTPTKETVYPYIYHGCISNPLTPDENGVYKVNFTDIR